jgi:glycosyltransferase involved in cell wall biosynthesis
MTKKTLSITFVLPGGGETPVGGFKVIYEYANALVGKGHRVAVVHPQILASQNNLIARLESFSRYLRSAIKKTYRPDAWFRIDPRVQLLWRPTLDACYVPNGDCVIATAWETAEQVSKYPMTKGKKYYFVQDYERYASATDDIKQRMGATYRLGMYMTYISPAVREMILESGGQPDLYLPNGIDFDQYHLGKDITSTERDSLGFPIRHSPIKGTGDAIRALQIVREQYPALKVWSFGPKPKIPLPAWVNHHVLPTDKELCLLYNASKLFILPSHYEGWGLPGCEAMVCGAALVTTDNGGCHAYATHDSNALIVKPKCPVELAQAVIRLLDDDRLRVKLAKKGLETVQQFTWERSAALFEAALIEGSH